MKFKNFAFIETERKEGASVISSNGIENDTLDKLLISALPSGKPADKFYKVINVDNHLYLSVLHILPDQDYGLALVVELAGELKKKNPISFVDNIYDYLPKLIKSKDYPNELSIKMNEIKPVFDDYKDFDVLIFSLLTSQKTVIVGDITELEDFIGTLYECIPLELRGYIGVAANMSNISNDEVISLVPISERVLQALDNRKEDYTVLLLPIKTAYGTYTSPVCKRIAKLFGEKKVESIKDEIFNLYKLAISSNVIEQIGEFAKMRNLETADASLVLWIRANHFGIEMEKSILEELNS